MKKLVAMMLALLMLLASTGMAEEIPFSEWIAGQDHVVTDVFAEDAPAPEVPASEAPAPEAPAFEPIGIGSRGETVAQLQAKLIELGILNSKADGVFGPASEAAVKYTQKALGWEETGVIQTADELNAILALVPGDGVNLAVGTSDEWSEWMAPKYDAENKCFTVANAYLGEKQVGDPYTCQVEIEFANVTVTPNSEGKGFLFLSQGEVDDTWGELGASNVWKSLVKLNEAPADGTYRFVATSRIKEINANSSSFDIGFRCDNWASGQFRVRCVKVEKGILATPWSHADIDIGDGTNLAVNTSSEWSDWMAPEYNAENKCFTLSTAYLGEKRIGEPYTCQVEIEFADVSVTQGLEDKSFLFISQGKVDDTWGEVGASNVWKSLVKLNEAPADGVYKYTITKKIKDINVNATSFDLGIRCDYWASGQFRVRCIKVEKGMTATDWTPAP